MIYSVRGTLREKKDHFAVVEVGGVGIKIILNKRTLHALPNPGTPLSLFCHLHVKEDALELYGFEKEAELDLFELLISVSGVGPKSALSVLEIAEFAQLSAAIKEGRPDLLTRASGIGRKTAERIILELKNKVEAKRSDIMIRKMESDSDIVEALTGLGYRRDQAKAALQNVDDKLVGLEARLKAALKILGGS